MDIRKDEENTCGYMTRCSGGVVLFQKMLTKFSGNLFQQNGLIHQMLRFTEESPVGSGNPLPPKWLYFKACWWNDLGTPPPGNKGKRPNPGWWNMVQPSRHLAILDFMTGLWTIGFLNKVLLDLYFWRGCTFGGVGWLAIMIWKGITWPYASEKAPVHPATQAVIATLAGITTFVSSKTRTRMHGAQWQPQTVTNLLLKW